MISTHYFGSSQSISIYHCKVGAKIRVIDQSFGVDHNNDLWPAEDEKWDEERLWGRSEDDSKKPIRTLKRKTRLSSCWRSRKRAPAPGFP